VYRLEKYRKNQLNKVPSLAKINITLRSITFNTIYPNRLYVKSLYKRYLTNALNWYIRRDLWRNKAIEIRADFERNRWVWHSFSEEVVRMLGIHEERLVEGKYKEAEDHQRRCGELDRASDSWENDGHDSGIREGAAGRYASSEAAHLRSVAIFLKQFGHL
jgi:hypothetical protein